MKEKNQKNDQKVKIYSTPSCHFCHMAKIFFEENDVEYEDYDVASDAQKRKEMIEMTGQMGVPVIQVGDKTIVGFDRGSIRTLLKL